MLRLTRMHLLFVYRKPHGCATVTPETLGALSLRVSIPVARAGGVVTERAVIATGLSLPKRWWDADRQAVRINKATPAGLLDYDSQLADWKRRATDAKRTLESEGKAVTAAAVVALMRRPAAVVYNLDDAVVGWLAYNDQRVAAGELAATSQRAYRYLAAVVARWPGYARLHLEQTTPARVEQLRTWVIAAGKKASTARNVATLVASATAWAYQQGWCPADPLAGRKAVGLPDPHEVDFYEPADVLKLAGALLPSKERAALDLHLLQVVTGLSFSDVVRYIDAPEAFHHTDPHSGRTFLRQRRTKARRTSGGQKQVALVPLSPAVAALVTLLTGAPLLRRMNAHRFHLERAARHAGLTRHVTTHLARRTFGAFALNAGIPLAEVSKMLGHESLETTRKAYAPILPTLVGESWYAVFGGAGEAPTRNVYREAMRELADVLVARAAKVGAARVVVDKAPEPWLLGGGEADWLNP